MPEDRTPQRELLDLLLGAARTLLDCLEGESNAPFRVELSRENRGHDSLHRYDVADVAGVIPVTPESHNPSEIERNSLLASSHLGELEGRIVLALAGGPLPGKSVAGRLRERFTSRLRYCLAGLVERGVLRKGDQGYEVAHAAYVEVARSHSRLTGS